MAYAFDTITIQVVRYLRCFDGEVRESYAAQMTAQYDPANPFGACTWSALALEDSATRADADRVALDFAGKIVGLARTVVTLASLGEVRTHIHVGEYGSPNRLPCDALAGR